MVKVTAKVTQIIGEDDGDLHLVLSDGIHTMIAEAPNADCNTGATPYRPGLTNSATEGHVTEAVIRNNRGTIVFDTIAKRIGTAGPVSNDAAQALGGATLSASAERSTASPHTSDSGRTRPCGWRWPRLADCRRDT